MHVLQCSYRSGKTGQSQGICVVSKRSGEILFWTSQGKVEGNDTWIMQTADPNVKKQTNVQLPLNVHMLEVFHL